MSAFAGGVLIVYAAYQFAAFVKRPHQWHFAHLAVSAIASGVATWLLK